MYHLSLLGHKAQNLQKFTFCFISPLMVLTSSQKSESPVRLFSLASCDELISQLNPTTFKRSTLKRVEGSRVKFCIFFGSNIASYSPDFLVSRIIGSFVSELLTVAEIWHDKVGCYAHFSSLIFSK